MSAPISVIMPVLNAEPGLRQSLPALAEGLDHGLIRELIMSDGGSTDATARIADAAGAVWVQGPAGRGGQIARGVAHAKAPWVLILHADTALQPGWPKKVLDAIAAPEAAHYGTLAFDVTGFAPRLVSGWANLRSRLFDLPYGDQALLIHKDLLDEIGGVPDLPLMEDVALARALRGRLAPLGITACTSATRYQKEGWLRRGSRNLMLLTRYLFGADPAQLAQAYRRPNRQD